MCSAAGGGWIPNRCGRIGGTTIDTVIAVLSDLHAGLRLSLLNPATRLRDANGAWWTPELTTTQRYLWSLYLEHRNQVRELARNRRLLLFLLGDLTQGLKHWSGVWGTTLYDHIRGAMFALEPYLELEPAAIRMVMGTESHTQDGTSELLIADELSRHVTDTDICQHYKTRVNGVPVDYAHHGPGAGTRAWTNGNVAGHYLKSLMLEEIVNRDDPPRLVLRAHVHRTVHELRELETKDGAIVGEIAVSPGYCGINPFARRTAQAPLTQTHGMIAAMVPESGPVVVYRLHRTIDVRKEEWL